MIEWRTRVDPTWTALFGEPELHLVLYEPNDDHGGVRSVVTVSIPESGRQQIRAAIKQAQNRRARMAFVCDTQEQADKIALMVTHRLPTHRRIAYERAEAGAWGARDI